MAVSDATENAQNRTLQDPELNPLLNPLLASHLGRWAEVYFTSPPEMRAQAVAGLVRELEREAGTGSTAVESKAPAAQRATANLQKRNYPLPASLLTQSDPPRSEFAACTNCGQENLRSQKFCGMCGSRLNPDVDPGKAAELAEGNERMAEAESVSPEPGVESDWANEATAIEGNSRPYATEADEAIGADPHRHHQYEPGEEEEDWSYASSVGDEDLPHFAREPESVPYRYRLYVGIVIAIVLVGLIYLARNGTDIFSSGQQSPASRNILPAQSSTPAEPVGTAPPAPVQKVEKDEAPPAQAVKPATKQERIPPKEIASARPLTRTGSASAGLARAPASNATTAPIAAASFGAEENAEAQKYLTQRNPAEAAQWLWKAVAKGNAGATVTLADLYLHGEGVPKNCDQGRLLLDIGAKKGAHGAAERLRNLQAFGCR
jgi:hypothetical protein